MRARTISDNTNNQIEVVLRQGASTITTWTFAPASGFIWATQTYTLTAAEADAITDYTDLRVRLDARELSGTDKQVNASQFELEVPDAGASESFSGSTTSAARARSTTSISKGSSASSASRARPSMVSPGAKAASASLRISARATSGASGGGSVAESKSGSCRVAEKQSATSSAQKATAAESRPAARAAMRSSGSRGLAAGAFIRCRATTPTAGLKVSTASFRAVQRATVIVTATSVAPRNITLIHEGLGRKWSVSGVGLKWSAQGVEVNGEM